MGNFGEKSPGGSSNLVTSGMGICLPLGIIHSFYTRFISLLSFIVVSVGMWLISVSF